MKYCDSHARYRVSNRIPDAKQQNLYYTFDIP